MLLLIIQLELPSSLLLMFTWKVSVCNMLLFLIFPSAEYSAYVSAYVYVNVSVSVSAYVYMEGFNL